jgi:hypothetical protein
MSNKKTEASQPIVRVVPSAAAPRIEGEFYQAQNHLDVSDQFRFIERAGEGPNLNSVSAGGKVRQVEKMVAVSEYKRRPGDRVGLNWRVPSIHGKRAIRHVLYDTNWWKSFTHARLVVAMGDRGCLSVYGSQSETHRMFAEQITAEYFIKTEGRGRTVDEWKARPEQPDNHWLDCLVGSAVAASMTGAILFGTDLPAMPKRDRVSFKELQRNKRR